MAGLATARAADSPDALRKGFQNPPACTKPWVYWYWISDNISKEGITHDLEAMARVGIGEALIGNIFQKDVPAGDVKVLSERWWGMIEHAIREGQRVGVNIGMFNCPGWSQSGGPWVRSGESMRYLKSIELRIHGPAHIEQRLPTPAKDFQDVALLAFPAPRFDDDRLAAHDPKFLSQPATQKLEHLVDGDTATAVELPAKGGRWTLDIEPTGPLTVRHISLVPGSTPWSAQCELQAAKADGTFATIKRFRFDRSNMEIHVGPMPRGPVVASLPAVTAKRFRLVLTQITGQAALAELDLSAAARLESYVEKQLGKMHPTPQPMWDTYLWPPAPEPASRSMDIPVDHIIDLRQHLSAHGILTWNVPTGDWVIVRTGMVPTGTRNAPAAPEAEGFEIDKMSRGAARIHFNAFIGEVLRRMPAAERKSFKHVVADSYEQGSENWTDGFADVFRKRYEYDPIPWLPVLSGRIVGSAAQSDRFLWDLRRLVADRIATEYVGGLRDLCHEHSLQLWLENYGHWGFPAEFLQYGGQSDRIGGEFWTAGGLGAIECRAASSAGNTYGLPIVSAEAFTAAGSLFKTAPSDLKARGDWAFCQGINHFVLHVYIHQPGDDRRPGVNAWFGTEFNRHNTWFADSRSWINYLRRCCYMLQQGPRVADVAYFIGEDAPKMTGTRRPGLPAGYDYDYVNAEVICNRSTVRNGRLVLPGGAEYRVLVLPPEATMRPRVLRKLHQLIRAGATVYGKPPVRSPSRQDYPRCDQQVRKLANEIWGTAPLAKTGRRSVGAGHVVWGEDLETVLNQLGAHPDFLCTQPLRYTHRRAGTRDIYFVANPEPREIVATIAVRAGTRAPSLWWPDSGRVTHPAVYDVLDDNVHLPLHLGPHASVFVVFDSQRASARRVVAVQRNGHTILDTRCSVRDQATRSGNAPAAVAQSFTIAMWAKPKADTTLSKEAATGVHGIQNTRNDAVAPTHGDNWGGSRHAGCGIAIGRNGVSVIEHGANYFAPTLVYKGRLESWTHVAVVYRNGQPSLFIDGKKVHTGLRGTHLVHPGAPVQSGAFVGQLGGVRTIARALDAAQIRALMGAMSRPDRPMPGALVQLQQRNDGTIRGLFWQAGQYILQRADRSKLHVEVNALPRTLEINGPWSVSFQSGLGTSSKTRFAKLADLSHNADGAIRYFSGKTTYRTTFVLPKALCGRPLRLTLGDVHDLAAVRVNGHLLRRLWQAPWAVDVTRVARPGTNELEVDVVNTWYNRLVGDANLPPAKRRTYVARRTVPKDAPLRPAGLLGPVRLRAGQAITWKRQP